MSSSFSYSYGDSPPSLHSPLYVTDESDDDQQSQDTEEVDMFTPPTITFARSDQILEIPSRETYSAEEKQAAWYKKEDYQEMKRRAFETIQFQRSGQLLSGNTDHCMRGLEGRTSDGFNAVKNNRMASSHAVIDEQDRQDEMGICDAGLLSDVYQRSSLQCKCLAFAQGLVDAQEVIKDILTQEGHAGVTGHQGASSSSTEAIAAISPFNVIALDQNMLLNLILNNAPEDEHPKEDMVMDSTLQIRFQQKDVDDTIPLDSMEWTAAEA